MDNDVLKGAKAAAAATGLTSREIFYLVEREYVPFRRVGRQLYFSRRTLLASLSPTEFEISPEVTAVPANDGNDK